MRQKTLYIDTNYNRSVNDIYTDYRVGDAVILYGYKREGAPDSTESFRVMKDNGKGMPGNMNSEICRYHGWRGTSDGIIKTAYGLRRIKSMETIDKYSNDEGHYQSVKIVVGADIAPEEE